MRSPASSRSPSPSADDSEARDAYARLGKLLNLDHLNDAPDTAEQDNDPSQPVEEDDEQEFEFRLFSAPTKSKEETTKQVDGEQDENATNTEARPASTTQKLRIRLDSPTPGSGEGGLVKASRDWDYYFSTPALSGTHDGEIASEDEDRIAEKKKQFENMAVSGDHMLGWAQSQAWVRALYMRVYIWLFDDH